MTATVFRHPTGGHRGSWKKTCICCLAVAAPLIWAVVQARCRQAGQQWLYVAARANAVVAIPLMRKAVQASGRGLPASAFYYHFDTHRNGQYLARPCAAVRFAANVWTDALVAGGTRISAYNFNYLSSSRPLPSGRALTGQP